VAESPEKAMEHTLVPLNAEHMAPEEAPAAGYGVL
jgi:hypothetical protein